MNSIRYDMDDKELQNGVNNKVTKFLGGVCYTSLSFLWQMPFIN